MFAIGHRYVIYFRSILLLKVLKQPTTKLNYTINKKQCTLKDLTSYN